MDVSVPSHLQKEFKQKLKEANISYIVKISDLQTAIDNENCNINERSVDEKLGNVHKRSACVMKLANLTKNNICSL